MRIRPALSVVVASAFVALLALPALAQQQAPASPPMRIRGQITKVKGDMITVKTRSGETVTAKLKEDAGFVGVKKTKFSDITTGKFVGIASQPQPDGSLKALEVLVFPESARGSNEGHYAWDLTPNSMMTNANITAAVAGKKGDELTLTPKDHDPVKITVPKNVPVVTFAPADKKMLKKGAKVLVVGLKQPDGSIVSPRVLIGIGITPPM